MMNIVDKLKDLVVQATNERSHNYVKATAEEAIAEIEALRGYIERERIWKNAGK